MLKEAFHGEKVVLIENEFGEIGIDGGFLQDAGIQITENIKELMKALKENGIDVDSGVNMGLYTCPVLMAADILLYNSELTGSSFIKSKISVGRSLL